jgi:uncharacterized protein
MKKKLDEAESLPKNHRFSLLTAKDHIASNSNIDTIYQPSLVSNNAGILLFLKYPEKGMVKNRLSKEIGASTAIDFYQCFVADILTMIKELGLPIVICYSPTNSEQKFKKWLGEDHLYIHAQGEDFGQKLKYCFQKAFTQGFHQVILLAGDNPDVPRAYLDEAIYSLRSNDVVIGPCEDGGYYLLGFTKTGFLSTIFDNIPWSTPQVFQKTLHILQKEKRIIHLLQKWYDIDIFEDLLKFYERNKDVSTESSKTMNAISIYLKKTMNGKSAREKR